jgi:hypothetical protein
MHRRRFMLITTAWVLAASVAAREQPAGASPRIAFLAGGSRAGDALLIEAFWRRMNELGYVEGATSSLSIALPREYPSGSRS